jgi:hypothetical protein
MKIIGTNYLKRISTSVETIMITNLIDPISFYSVLSTYNTPSAYVVIVGSKDKGSRLGTNASNLDQITSSNNHIYIIYIQCISIECHH